MNITFPKLIQLIKKFGGTGAGGGGGSGGAFVVNFSTKDGQTYTADKTFDEVYRAALNAQPVCAMVFDVPGVVGLMLYCSYFNPGFVEFDSWVKNMTYFSNHILYNSDGSVIIESVEHSTT